MQHTTSLDDESLLTRSAASQLMYDPAEVAADAFATHFLLPRWLFVAQAARHKWGRKDLLNPVVIYQLSLRAGVSYQATCIALYRHQLIDRKAFEQLFVAEVKAIKRQILANYELDDWYPDVWLLTETDEGSVIEGDVRDAFVLRLNENSCAGYLWNIDGLKEAGFLLFRDQRLTLGGEDNLGGPVERVVGARPGNSQYGQVALKQIRPWQKNAAPISRFSFTFDLRGKESGRPRVERHSLVAA
jgi:predicted secreted protein